MPRWSSIKTSTYGDEFGFESSYFPNLLRKISIKSCINLIIPMESIRHIWMYVCTGAYEPHHPSSFFMKFLDVVYELFLSTQIRIQSIKRSLTGAYIRDDFLPSGWGQISYSHRSHTCTLEKLLER